MNDWQGRFSKFQMYKRTKIDSSISSGISDISDILWYLRKNIRAGTRSSCECSQGVE